MRHCGREESFESRCITKTDRGWGQDRGAPSREPPSSGKGKTVCKTKRQKAARTARKVTTGSGEASVRVAEGTSHGLAIRGQGRAAEDHVSQPPAAAAAAAGKRKARDMNVRDAETFRAVQVEVTFMTVAAGGPIFGSDVLLKSLLLVR